MMKTWSDGGSTLGLWLSSTESWTAELASLSLADELGIDYINIDMQHGLSDYRELFVMLQVMSASNATVTVRVPWNDPGIIGKVLDAGAMGVIVPMVNTAEQAQQVVSSCHFAPLGSRSHGPVRAKAVFGDDYVATANANIACIPMIETAEAVQNLDEILAVGGMDAVYVGPADLSLTLGLEPAPDHPDDASFNEALATIVEKTAAAGVVAGIHSTENLVKKRLDQGFRMVTVTSDIGAFTSGLKRAFTIARGGDDGAGGASMY